MLTDRGGGQGEIVFLQSFKEIYIVLCSMGPVVVMKTVSIKWLPTLGWEKAGDGLGVKSRKNGVLGGEGPQ